MFKNGDQEPVFLFPVVAWYNFVDEQGLIHEFRNHTKLIVSIVIGVVIGGEREYRNKSAGLRTIILICLGSTIFTILSENIGDETERSRIASNVVTGIGFLGAGAIMREGLTISGLTTASTIWVAAALGMAVGTGEYLLASFAVIFAFIVLTAFGYFEEALFNWVNKTLSLQFSLEAGIETVGKIEDEMKRLGLKFTFRKQARFEKENQYNYDITGKERQIKSLVSYLSSLSEVKSFTY